MPKKTPTKRPGAAARSSTPGIRAAAQIVANLVRARTLFVTADSRILDYWADPKERQAAAEGLRACAQTCAQLAKDLYHLGRAEVRRENRN